MNRVDFIKALAAELSEKVRPSEIHQLINYYDEMIEDLMEEGYTEEEAVARLGSPKELIQAVTETEEVVVEIPRRFHPFLLLILVLGFPLWGSLLLSAALLILSFLIIIWCVPFTTGMIGVTTFIGGIASVVLSPVLMADGFYLFLSQLGMGIFLFGLGLLCLIATYSMSRPFSRLTHSLVVWPKLFVQNYRKKAVL